jgi:hypothetical protein
LTCNFVPIDTGQSEYTGTVDVRYMYDYEYVKSESFTVYPSR